jgi:ferredoxin
VRRLALPYDAPSDEIAVEVVVCGACGADAAVVFEASRRGALDEEAFRRDLVALPPDDLDVLDDAIAACPAPLDARCACAAHRHLGRTDATARWVGLPEASRGLRGALLAARREPGLAVPDGAVVPEGGPSRGAALAAALARPVAWRRVAGVERPYAADVDGARWRLVLGDVPAEPPYALEVEGAVAGAFDDGPDGWTRP